MNMIAMNGTNIDPEDVVSLINERKLSREELENATWTVEIPQATLELAYEFHDGSSVEFEFDLYELDDSTEWDQVREWEVSVKYCFLRVGNSEWELDLDLPDEEDTKRPDSLSLNTWTESDEIEFGDLWEYGNWEDVPNALEDLEDEDRQLKEDEEK